ncbi:MAG TPA: TRAP transporter substrate-binding protein [Anaerovoracaceae bacterium]|nr:TRAP transporter substrate-binding protein [Anaerovoracaceae bacterium]
MKMRKRLSIILALTLAFVMIVSLAGCGDSGSTQAPDTESDGAAQSTEPEFVLKIGHDMPETHPYHNFCLAFKEEVEKNSNGRIQIDIFSNAVLGSEVEMTEGLRLGTLDFLVSTTANSSSLIPKLGVLGMPFLYQSVDHAVAVTHDPDILVYWQDVVKDADVGITLLNIAASGWRNIYSTFPVTKLEDLKGVNLRCQAAEIEAKIWTALGCNTVTMPISEVYTSFQTGLIDAAENCATSYVTNAHNEVAPYFSQTEHTLMIHPILASNQALEKLDGDLQKVVYDAAATASDALFDAQQKLDAENLQKAIDGGVTYTENVDMSAAYQTAAEYHKQFAADLGASDGLDAIMAKVD